MSLVKCRICRKNETYNPSGVCVICEKFGGVVVEGKDKEIQGKIKEDKKEKFMSKKPYPGQEHKKKESKPSNCGTSRTCARCKKDYTPTSNAQKTCPDCKIEIKKERDRERKKPQVSRKGTTGRPSPHLPPPQADHPLPSASGGSPLEKQVIARSKTPPLSLQDRFDRSNLIGSGQAPQSNDGKTACLGQLLYASDLLDSQINSAIESGDIDTKIILDIRSRLGHVLRGSFPLAEAPA